MNNQEFFNKSVAHLRKQGCKSISTRATTSTGGVLCTYKTTTEAGAVLMCAVGGVMTPEVLADLETSSSSDMYQAIGSIMEKYESARLLFSGVDPMLLRRMQAVHDVHPVSSWEGLFQIAAESYNLEYTAP